MGKKKLKRQKIFILFFFILSTIDFDDIFATKIKPTFFFVCFVDYINLHKKHKTQNKTKKHKKHKKHVSDFTCKKKKSWHSIFFFFRLCVSVRACMSAWIRAWMRAVNTNKQEICKRRTNEKFTAGEKKKNFDEVRATDIKPFKIIQLNLHWKVKKFFFFGRFNSGTFSPVNKILSSHSFFPSFSPLFQHTHTLFIPDNFFCTYKINYFVQSILILIN